MRCASLCPPAAPRFEHPSAARAALGRRQAAGLAATPPCSTIPALLLRSFCEGSHCQPGASFKQTSVLGKTDWQTRRHPWSRLKRRPRRALVPRAGAQQPPPQSRASLPLAPAPALATLELAPLELVPAPATRALVLRRGGGRRRNVSPAREQQRTAHHGCAPSNWAALNHTAQLPCLCPASPSLPSSSCASCGRGRRPGGPRAPSCNLHTKARWRERLAGEPLQHYLCRLATSDRQPR